MISHSREWSLLSDDVRAVFERHQRSLPIKIGAIASELGLKVKSSTLEAGISGEIRKGEGQYVIRVNRHDVKHRQRFTVAHEIAHYLLHKSEIGDGIVDDVLYRSPLSDVLEAQANRLAADILMPWSHINEKLKSYSALKMEERIEKLALDLEVSITALQIRLGRR